MHNLISIIRCEFVSVSNIQQKYMHRFSLNFQDRSNIAQETTWGILRMFQTTMRMCVNVYVLYMCVVGVGVGVGGGGWMGAVSYLAIQILYLSYFVFIRTTKHVITSHTHSSTLHASC